MDLVIEQSDTEYGFTWGNDGTRYYLRNPDNKYRIVPESVLKGLKAHADEISLSELTELTAEADPNAATTLEALIEEDFLRSNTPVLRLNPPDDIPLWPKAIISGLVLLVGGILVRLVYGSLTTLALPGGIISADILIVAAVVFVTTSVHEAGHYVAARPHLDPNFDISIKNGVFIALVMRTNDVYVHPTNRSRWMNLAGPVSGVAVASVISTAYLILDLSTAVGIGILVAMWVQVFALIPIFHGDGYQILIETFDAPNLRYRGIENVKNKQLTWASAFVLVSYGLPILIFCVATLGAIMNDRHTDWIPFLALLVLVYAWSNRKSFSEKAHNITSIKPTG